MSEISENGKIHDIHGLHRSAYPSNDEMSLLNKLANKSISEDKNNESNALRRLISMTFNDGNELNQPIPKYNWSTRIDILSEFRFKRFKSPVKLLNILKFLKIERDRMPSYGLKIDQKYAKSLFIPFIYDYGDNTEGIFYIDQDRPLTIRDVYRIEKSIEQANIDAAYIVLNEIGMPAKNLVKRINDERRKTISYDYYDTIVMKLKIMYN
jgi:hypothetical protein